MQMPTILTSHRDLVALDHQISRRPTGFADQLQLVTDTLDRAVCGLAELVGFELEDG